DEMRADRVSYASRPAVQHEPYGVRFIQTHLDEVIAGSQRSQMGSIVAVLEARILRRQARKRLRQHAPSGVRGGWRLISPSTLVALPHGASVRHRALDRRTDRQ